jgi:transposase-like protein
VSIIIPNKKGGIKVVLLKMIKCKNCQSEKVTKNGKVRNKQRYKCKRCGYNFVEGHAHYSEKKLAKKALVVLLYSLGKGTYRMLGKIFGVSNGTVQNWIKEAERTLPEIEINEEITEIEFDEMWHYVGKKNENCGLSRQLTANGDEPLRGCLAVAVRQLLSGSTEK